MKKIGKFIGSWFPNLKLLNQTYTDMSKYDRSEVVINDPYAYTGKVVPGTIKVVLEMME
jgi:hypothetical protein